MPAPYTAKGWTATLPGSFSMSVVAMTPPGPNAEPIDVTHLGTSGATLAFMASDFYDGGEFQLRGFFDPDLAIPVNQAGECVINFTNAGKKWTFNGIVTSYEPGEATFNERAEATLTVKVNGTITIDNLAP